MTRYIIENKQRILLLCGIGVGLLCLLLTWMGDDSHHTRFWSNFLHNSVFFTGISFMSVFFYSVCTTAWAGWHVVFKRVWEAMGMFLGIGIVLIGIITISTIMDANHLYHWADAEAVKPEVDKVLAHKSSFLNNTWYFISFLFLVVWFLIAYRIRSISLNEDTIDDRKYSQHFKLRFWTALFLPLFGFSMCLVIWQWVMSVDAHWYSTLYAWYAGASLFVSMIGMTILILIFLKSQGYYPNVSLEHFHDLGKFLFAFSIFWTYLWFSQYMLIWYSNNGEETTYFKTRRDEFPVLFYGNLIINFVLPFFLLMRNDSKRKYGTLIFVSLVVIFGHWADFFLMIKPGVLHTSHSEDHNMGGVIEGAHDAAVVHGTEMASHAAHEVSSFIPGYTLPGFLEVGTMIGFLSLFLFVFYSVLSRANLVAKNDPYLSESLHHHV